MLNRTKLTNYCITVCVVDKEGGDLLVSQQHHPDDGGAAV